MRDYTNMARADDPYRTGQQLYRRPGPMLTAFAIRWCIGTGGAPGAVAVVHLLLHRSRALTVTEDTVGFGFRAACASDAAGLAALATLADLALLQARRHAAFLAADALLADLAELRQWAPGVAHRGLAAVETEWRSRATADRGKARMIDSALDLSDEVPPGAGCGPAGAVPSAPSIKAGLPSAPEPGRPLMNCWRRRRPGGR